MEIRHRLTLQFTLLVALLLAAILGFNYYLSSLFAKDSFLERLKERATIIANVHLESDKINQNRFDLMDKKYNPGLQAELIVIFDKDLKIRYIEGIDSLNINTQLIQQLQLRQPKPLEKGGRTFIGFPFEDDQGSFFVVATAIDLVGNSKLRNMAQSMVISFFIFLVFTILAGHFLSKKALEPIQSVIFQVNAISASNLHERVQYNNEKDEIAQLSKTFNSMLNRLEDAFVSQLAFVCNASHELRNPLAAMIGQAEITLMKARDNIHYQEVIKTIYSDALRLKQIVNSLLQLSQATTESEIRNHTLINLDELLLDIIEPLSRTKGYNQIEILLPEEMDEQLHIKGNLSLLEVAIGNLIDNACKYSDGKPVLCKLEKRDQNIYLIIEDHGLGMGQEDLKYCMEPFYRSSHVRNKEGFGIGLAVASTILNSHGIGFSIQSQEGKGTTIHLSFQEEKLSV